MHIEVDEIACYAGERNEDGTICNAIGYLLARVSNMPKAHWGELPWSGEWHEAWTKNLDWRRKEASRARKLMFDTSDTLFQALANYSGADIKAAGKLERVADGEYQGVPPGLVPYLRSDVRDDGRYSIGTYRPGANHRFDHRYKEGDGNIPFSNSPPGNPDIYDHTVPSGPVDNYTGKPADDYHDELWVQMKANGNFLGMIEKEVLALDSSIGKFYSRHLMAAFKARPVSIDNHGEEILVAYKAYKGVADALRKANQNLPHQWSGDGGESFYNFADNVMMKYIETTAGEAKWIGESTKTAAAEIKKLRNKYAAAIETHTPEIKRRYQDYSDTAMYAFQTVVAIATLDPAGAAGSLLEAVRDLSTRLSDIRDQTQSAGADLTRASEHALSVPDFDSQGHRAESPVADDSPSGNDWRSPKKW